MRFLYLLHIVEAFVLVLSLISLPFFSDLNICWDNILNSIVLGIDA